MSVTKPTAYFWDSTNQKVVEFFSTTSVGDIPECLFGMYCVDVTEIAPRTRYGKYFGEAPKWKRIPIEDFPKEFRVHLLLLGVT